MLYTGSWFLMLIFVFTSDASHEQTHPASRRHLPARADRSPAGAGCVRRSTGTGARTQAGRFEVTRFTENTESAKDTEGLARQSHFARKTQNVVAFIGRTGA